MNGKRKVKMKWLTTYRTGFHSCCVWKEVKVPWRLRKPQPVKCKEVVTWCLAGTLWSCVIFTKQVWRRLGNHTTDSLQEQVAPLTPITVPRLELIGAIVGLRLTQSVSSTRSTVKGFSLLLWQQGHFMVGPRTRERFRPLCWIGKIQSTLIQLNGIAFPLNKI